MQITIASARVATLAAAAVRRSRRRERVLSDAIARAVSEISKVT